LSFTSIPYWAYYGLASVEDKLTETPEFIVVMGGDGMPSPSGLMRTYYGINKAKQFPNTKIILALPYNQKDSTKQLNLMAHEFVLKGIDTSRIYFEPNGFNTKSQAMQVDQLIEDKNAPLLIVTSPEHTFRCLATFRKQGFTAVGGNPTFENPSDEEMLKDKTEDEKNRVRNLNLRYNIWSYMQYEIIVMREYCAIAYYWLNGWI
jgi:uncharacterized SAM-binding protein YcdF (DUF218 family)